MIAAILCPGPSLAKWPRETFDAYPLTVGVNRAAVAYPVQWWAWLDGSLFNQVAIDHTPRILSSAEAVRRVREDYANERLARHDVRIVEHMWDFCPASVGWTTYTVTAAIILAAEQGARVIDIYGSDMTDAPDFDGVSLPENRRNVDRWEHERNQIRQVREWLAPRGITLNRITPEQ